LLNLCGNIRSSSEKVSKTALDGIPGGNPHNISIEKRHNKTPAAAGVLYPDHYQFFIVTGI
jgi:hypothetical protein